MSEALFPSIAHIERRVFHTLDGLRGIAALAVLVMHEPHHGMFQLPRANLAVDLFFALSGFIVSHAYEHRLKAGLTALGLMRVRWIRLFPLFFLGLILGALYFIIERPGAVSIQNLIFALVAGVLFLPAPPPSGALFTLNIPAWSLFFEMAVNLVFAFTALRLTPRVLWVVVGAGALALVAAVIHYRGFDIGWGYSSFAGGCARVWFSFFAGVGLYRFWRAGALSWLRIPAWALFMATLALFAIPAGLGGFWTDLAIVLFVLPAFVLGGARTEPAKWLAPLCTFLGFASYPIYILQSPIMGFTISIFDRLTHPGLLEKGLFGLVSITGVVVAGSILAGYIYDAPVRSWLTRLDKAQSKARRARRVSV